MRIHMETTRSLKTRPTVSVIDFPHNDADQEIRVDLSGTRLWLSIQEAITLNNDLASALMRSKAGAGLGTVNAVRVTGAE